MLLSLSSIFEDFFDSPEDDPLLQENEEGAPENAENAESSQGSKDPSRDAEPASDDASESAISGDGHTSDTHEPVTSDSTGPAPHANPAIPEGLSSNLLRHGQTGQTPPPEGDAQSSPHDDESTDAQDAPKRTRKFVVPYNASSKDLEEVNEAVSTGWSFRRIAVTRSRTASVKPEGKKVIITLELDEPRSLFDF